MEATTSFQQSATKLYSDPCPASEYSEEIPSQDSIKKVFSFTRKKLGYFHESLDDIVKKDIEHFYDIHFSKVIEFIDSKLNNLPKLSEFDFDGVINSSNQKGSNASNDLKSYIDKMYKEDQEKNVTKTLRLIIAYKIYYFNLMRNYSDKRTEIVNYVDKLHQMQRLCENYIECYAKLHRYKANAEIFNLW